jgi:hypothetical protein
MAETTNHLRDLLEKIKGDAQRALALLPSETELQSLGWKCTACGHVKHFHAAGHGSGRGPLSEMQRRLLSDVLAHYAAHSTQRSSAFWATNFVASELLPLQICGDFGELSERGLKIFNNFLSDHIRIGEVRAVFEGFVFEPENIEIELIALD